MKAMLTFMTAVMLLVSSDGYCAAPIEPEAVALEKSYANGDRVEISCGKSRSGACTLKINIGRRSKRVFVDFGAAKLEPLMDTVRLFVQSREDFLALIEVGVRCRAQDEQLALDAKAQAADCYASLRVDDEGVAWEEVQVRPISNVNLYNDI